MAMLDWLKGCSEGPYDLYRSTYKYTACGPTVGFRFEYEEDEYSIGAGDYVCVRKESDWVWCDDLRKWPDWEQLEEGGIVVLGVAVGSIVEGVDQCADTIYLEEDPDEPITEAMFDEAVETVDKQADEIWKETHGCGRCSELANHVGLYGDTTEGWDGITPCHADCDNPDCMGDGVPI